MVPSLLRYFYFLWNQVSCAQKIADSRGTLLFIPATTFVQSAIVVWCQVDKNHNCCVVAKIREGIAKKTYDFQTEDRTRHFMTKYLINEKMHAIFNNKFFNRLAHITSAINTSKWKWRSQGLNKKRQSLQCFLKFSKTLIWDFQSSITTSL